MPQDKQMKKIDTHLLVWIWPVTLVFGLIMLAIAYAVYLWLVIGNWVIDKTINNPKLQ